MSRVWVFRLWTAICAVLILCLFCPCQARSQSPVQYCQNDESQGIDTCIAVVATKHNESSATNDLYIRISAVFPHRLGWAAFGTGNVMEGSLMFIIYPGEGEHGTNFRETVHNALPIQKLTHKQTLP